MNYYERHLGDYAKDTAHLSMLEHGAYTLLMDRYYSTELPIPQDQTYRVTRARSKEEKLAVDVVLAEFFKLVDGFYTKGRIDEEITKVQSKIKAAQENGKRGGRPKKNPKETKEKPTGLFLGSEIETGLKAHQSPVTSHQSSKEQPHAISPVRAPILDASPIDREGWSTDQTEPPPPVDKPVTTAGSICFAMRKSGLQDANPSNQKLLTLIAAGATQDEFVTAAQKAVAGKHGFAYALGIVSREREQAKAMIDGLLKGDLPAQSPAAVTTPSRVATDPLMQQAIQESMKTLHPVTEIYDRLKRERATA